MKKSGIFCIIVLFSMNSIAQPQQKGKFFIGGLAGFNLSNTESEGVTDFRETTSKRLDIGIPFGYFVSNTFLVGLIPGYERYCYTSESSSEYTYSTQSERKNDQFTIGPFVRSYFKISEKVNFFLDLNAVVGFGKESYNYTVQQDYSGDVYETETSGKITSIVTGIYPGVSFQLSRWLFVDASIGRIGYDYNMYKPENKSNTDEELMSNSFAFSFNTFRFGLSAKLGK